MQLIKDFYDQLVDTYPKIQLYYEYDSELGLHFVWHTNAEYDNDNDFEVNTYRLRSNLFESNNIYNVVFSYMSQNHLTSSSVVEDNKIVFDKTDPGDYCAVDFQDNQCKSVTRVNLNTSIDISLTDKLVRINDTSLQYTDCPKNRETANNATRLAA